MIMTLDLDAIAARMYPTMAPNAQTVPPVEAKQTTNTAATKPAEHIAAEAAATKTTITEQKPDVSYALALPDDALIDAGAIERTTAFAKAAGLSPEAAQKALEHANGEVAAYQDQQLATWTKLTRETWVNDVKNDPELGGEKYTGAVADAKRFLAVFGDEEVRQFLEATGFGNNRFVIRMLSRAAKRLANDKLPAGSGGKPKSDAEVLYGNTARS
jgi:hypothetical protein